MVLGALMGMRVMNNTIDRIQNIGKRKRRNRRRKSINQMKLGTKMEREHKETYKKFKKNCSMKPKEFYSSIAKDHIKEHPKYYTNLKKMESRLKKKKSFRRLKY